MTDILTIADELWTGARRVEDNHPFALLGEAQEVADGVAFVPSFANVSAFATEDGLVLVDTGSLPLAQHIHSHPAHVEPHPAAHRGLLARAHRPRLRRGALRAGGTRARAGVAPRVVAHQAMPARFDRYR